MAPWTSADIPDQTGRTIVVTGANTGLGLSAARELVAHGADVVMACRNMAKGEKAAAVSRDGVPGTCHRGLDLADLASVRKFAAAPRRARRRADEQRRADGGTAQRTADGFEMQFGTNHLGPLRAHRAAARPHHRPRGVLSSLAHRLGRIHLDDLNWERRRYQRWLPTASPSSPT